MQSARGNALYLTVGILKRESRTAIDCAKGRKGETREGDSITMDCNELVI